MGKPRSAIAVRGSTKALLDEALKAFSKTLSERRDAKDFDEVIDFTREHCEELGGQKVRIAGIYGNTANLPSLETYRCFLRKIKSPSNRSVSIPMN